MQIPEQWWLHLSVCHSGTANGLCLDDPKILWAIILSLLHLSVLVVVMGIFTAFSTRPGVAGDGEETETLSCYCYYYASLVGDKPFGTFWLTVV